jgi:hypothetical protein
MRRWQQRPKLGLLWRWPAVHRSGWGSGEPVGPEEAELKKEGMQRAKEAKAEAKAEAS